MLPMRSLRASRRARAAGKRARSKQRRRAAMPIDWSLVPEYAAAFVFGYLCGSIPFGILLTRLAGAPDLRAVGSGNIGATNVLRTGRKGLAAATLLGDILKGTAAVLIVHHFFGRDAAVIAAAGAF